jgi:hypothetical protein
MALLNDIQGRTTQIMVYGSHHPSQDMAALLANLGNLPLMLPPDCCIIWVLRTAEPLSFPSHVHGRRLIPVLLDPMIDAPRGRWLQDPFLCLNDHEQTKLVVTRDAGAFALDAGQRIAAATGQDFCPVELRFAGGNMLRLDDVLLIGKDLALENGIPPQGDFLAPDQAAWAALEDRITTQLKVKQVVWVGLRCRFQPKVKPVGQADVSWQPFFHLDLFVLPGGRNAEGALRLFLGELHPVTDIQMGVLQRTALEEMTHALDEIAEQLRDALPGLELLRLPIIVYPSSTQLRVNSLCNGWLDRTAEGDWAYLPDYRQDARWSQYEVAIAEAHAVAEERLLSCGITPRWVQMDFKTYAKDGGALHCAVKVMKRNP